MTAHADRTFLPLARHHPSMCFSLISFLLGLGLAPPFSEEPLLNPHKASQLCTSVSPPFPCHLLPPSILVPRRTFKNATAFFTRQRSYRPDMARTPPGLAKVHPLFTHFVRFPISPPVKQKYNPVRGLARLLIFLTPNNKLVIFHLFCINALAP